MRVGKKSKARWRAWPGLFLRGVELVALSLFNNRSLKTTNGLVYSLPYGRRGKGGRFESV